MPPSPKNGPRILFFSGGTALRSLSRALKQRTHNSVHLVTPFDSGGSSARLREAFAMPSVGDLRNRLLALADESLPGAADVYRFVSYRLDAAAEHARLEKELSDLGSGDHMLVAALGASVRDAFAGALRAFAARMPAGFDLRGASIGNLALAGAYLEGGRDLEPVIAWFSDAIGVLGIVRPIVYDDVHLAATLADGSHVVGQHRMTGKESAPLRSRVTSLSLVRHLDAPQPACAEIDASTYARIAGADLIVFPMGSFFTSVVANLLPRGAGRAIAEARCPKIYVPSTGLDPEQVGMSLADSVAFIVETIARDAGRGIGARDAVTSVLLDPARDAYTVALDTARLDALGIEVLETHLVAADTHGRIAPELLAERLTAR